MAGSKNDSLEKVKEGGRQKLRAEKQREERDRNFRNVEVSGGAVEPQIRGRGTRRTR